MTEKSLMGTEGKDPREWRAVSKFSASQWLLGELQYASTQWSKALAEGEKDADYFKRKSDLLSELSNNWLRNDLDPEVGEDVQKTIMQKIIEPFARDKKNQGREAELAMTIAAYLHSLPPIEEVK